MKIFSILAELFFPRACFSCNREGRYVCEICSLFVSPAEFICPYCLKPSYFGKKHKKCKGDMLGLVSLLEYEGLIKRILVEIKEEGIFHALEEMAEHGFFLAGENDSRIHSFLSFLLDEKTCITFVPLHFKEKRKRGFDQSEILAAHLARAVGKRANKLIKRIDLQKKGEQEIIFDLIPGKQFTRIVIVDDFWLSGATMKECARVLKNGGAEEIWGFVLARVP